MIVNIGEQIKFYDGSPVVDHQSKTAITIGGLIRGVMNSHTDEPWTPESLLRCAELARRASIGDTANFDDEERAFIKTRAGSVYRSGDNSPLFFSCLHTALSDPPAPPEADTVPDADSSPASEDAPLTAEVSAVPAST